ncbi:hypothetical protein [Psychrobacillus sp. FSL K6-1267]|uniref:hypothetical protein n=1 Tax=Psychrobacillus sp. FSL K6-1267 TaxID=2921543 RepID=UPI0030F86E44
MLLAVKLRLAMFGIPVSNDPKNTDDMMLTFIIEKVTNHIKNQTNLYSIPDGLREIAIDMVVGEFLYTKKSMGLLNIDSLNFEVMVKQVQDGDTNTVFAVEEGMSLENQFNHFLSYLQHPNADFAKYRVLTW